MERLQAIFNEYTPDVIALNDNSPEPLHVLCLQAIVNNIESISVSHPTNPWRKLKNYAIPSVLCDRLLDAYQKKNMVNDNIAEMLRDRSKIRIRVVKLYNARITDNGLQALLEHKPTELELINCDYLTYRSLDIIGENSENLVSLKIWPMPAVTAQETSFNAWQHYYRVVKLRRLTIQYSALETLPMLFYHSLENLTHLNLSEYNCSSSLWHLQRMKNLKSLILHSVFASRELVDCITTLKSLEHLDVSQTNDRRGKYTHPNLILSKIVNSLPLLTSLDISGTNLAGGGAGAVMTLNPGTPESTEVRCDIPGLVARVKNPLEFLGLYGTHHEACKRHDIPAKIISGDANENQILIAAVAYIERPSVMVHVLSDLYYLFRYDANMSSGRALGVVLDVMEKHLSEKQIQISGSATLFYIVKGKDKPLIKMKLRNRIITVLLDGMEAHLGDETLMRNGCLTLCQFTMPNDVYMGLYNKIRSVDTRSATLFARWYFCRNLKLNPVFEEDTDDDDFSFF